MHPELYGILDAPVPILVGIPELYPDAYKSNDLIRVNLDHPESMRI